MELCRYWTELEFTEHVLKREDDQRGRILGKLEDHHSYIFFVSDPLDRASNCFPKRSQAIRAIHTLLIALKIWLMPCPI